MPVTGPSLCQNVSESAKAPAGTELPFVSTLIWTRHPCELSFPVSLLANLGRINLKLLIGIKHSFA